MARTYKSRGYTQQRKAAPKRKTYARKSNARRAPARSSGTQTVRIVIENPSVARADYGKMPAPAAKKARF